MPSFHIQRGWYALSLWFGSLAVARLQRRARDQAKFVLDLFKPQPLDLARLLTLLAA